MSPTTMMKRQGWIWCIVVGPQVFFGAPEGFLVGALVPAVIGEVSERSRVRFTECRLDFMDRMNRS